MCGCSRCSAYILQCQPGADPGFVVRGAWVGEGSGDRLMSPAGRWQSPCRGPRVAKPPPLKSSGGLRNYRHLIERQFWTNHTIFIRPKKYWFSFNALLISLIGLYFRCLSFRVVLVNTARLDGAFLFVVWFIHWKRMIRLFLFIDKQKRKLSIHNV